ncbi:MAG: hypothetical protein SFU25_07475, partial [Candidatus Caenarcaniphilales bacterium]|nr:hypothetical protein [Candidatus Caenarcaniphilales bacterium]
LTKLLCLQVSLFYFGAGIFKLFQPVWSNGEILEMNMASNWGTPLSFWLLNLNLPSAFYDLATLGVVWLETLFGILLWIKPIQKYVFTIGIFFHLSVWLLLSIPEFMLCPFTYVLFVDGNIIEKLGDKIVTLYKTLFQAYRAKFQKAN